MSPFAIRKIALADNAAVANLIRTVMPEFGCDGPGFAIHDAEVDQMYQAFADPRAAYFVLENQGEVVGGGGFAQLKGGAEDICELKKMYFLPQARGTGMGRELLQLCLSEAKKRDFRKCYLETAETMTQARKLYDRMGFTVLDGPLGNTGHHGCDRWYVRDL